MPCLCTSGSAPRGPASHGYSHSVSINGWLQFSSPHFLLLDFLCVHLLRVCLSFGFMMYILVLLMLPTCFKNSFKHLKCAYLIVVSRPVCRRWGLLANSLSVSYSWVLCYCCGQLTLSGICPPLPSHPCHNCLPHTTRAPGRTSLRGDLSPVGIAGGVASPAYVLGKFQGHSCVCLKLRKGRSQAGCSYFWSLFLSWGHG